MSESRVKSYYYKLVSWLLDHLWSQIGFAGQSSWRFQRKGSELELEAVVEDNARGHRVVIAARSLCFEIEKHIPVDSWREAYRIAQNVPVSSPFEGVRRVKLVPAQAGGFQALISMIDTSKVDAASRESMLLLIPISWLAHKMDLSEAVEVDFARESFGLVSLGELGVTAVINSPTQRRDFWWSMGKAAEEVGHVGESEVLTLLPSALLSMGWPQWLDASRGLGSATTFSLESFDWMKFGQVLGSFFVGYLLLTSLLLAAYGGWISSALSTEPESFTEALAVKREINELTLDNEQWTTLVGEQHPVWVLWPVVEELRLAGVTIRSVRYAEGAVEFFLLAEKATDVLDQLIASPYAANVEFGAPVKSDRRTQKETFSLRWELADPTATSEGAE